MKFVESLYTEHVKSIREHGVDQKALLLNQNLKATFNVKSKYFLFNGDLQAKTVFVMLNAGVSKDNNRICEGDLHTKSNEEIAKEIMEFSRNYAISDYERLDNFDLKQSAFLNNWEDTGIEIIKNFWEKDKKENEEVWKDAKRNILRDKLQLELIPYGSAEFVKLFDSQKLANKNVPYITEYLENIFKIITAYDRNIILFGSKQFYFIFKALKKIGWEISLLNDTESFSIEGLKNKVSFSVFEIEYNNKTFRAGIANSFPRRDLPNAYKQMALYGEKCFEIYTK